MSSVAIVTDSNSGISQAEGKELGIYVIPMPCLVDGKLYYENVDITKEQFYHFMESDADLTTSQPSPGDVMDLWDKLLKEYDEIVHIPMSSGLSASCSTAMGLAQDYDGKVQVVNNQRISVTIQYLFGSRYLKISEKRRPYHTGCSTSRICAEPETASSDPGRKTGCLQKSPWYESCQEKHAGCHEERCGRPFCRLRCKRSVKTSCSLYHR